MKKLTSLLLLVACILLAACGSGDDVELPPEPEDGVLIYAALNPMDKALELALEKFNEEHTDVQIELRDYSGEGGPQRLLVELAAGRVPDIMELQRMGREDFHDSKNVEALWSSTPLEADLSGFYWMPYRQMVQKGYLEDLWPYIENDPELGREGVLEAPLRAAEVDGGLYMLFKEVAVNTLIGSKAMLGSRSGWTLAELREAFSAMPPDATILRYDATQNKVFTALLSPMLEQYVDWEAGQCHFDNDDFRSMVEFLKVFPAEFETSLTAAEVEKEVVWKQMDGLQMLETTSFGGLQDIPYYNSFFEGGAAFIGYPTSDGSAGSSFLLLGRKTAMSSTCRDKEAAWEFMRRTIQSQAGPSLQHAVNEDQVRIRINRKDYQQAITAELNNSNKTSRGYVNVPAFSGGPARRVYFPVQEDVGQYEALISGTTQIYWPNSALSDVVWDAIGPYLAGDKTMDETIRLVQNRVGLYVNENR